MRSWLAAAAAAALLAGAVGAYPIDGYEDTRINRLQGIFKSTNVFSVPW